MKNDNEASIEYSSGAWDVVMSKLNMDFALFQSLVNIHSSDQKEKIILSLVHMTDHL